MNIGPGSNMSESTEDIDDVDSECIDSNESAGDSDGVGDNHVARRSSKSNCVH